MDQATAANLEIPSEFKSAYEKLMAERDKLIAQREARCADMPLKFWNQHAHFTTPASGTPEKAIKGLTAVEKIMKRFTISAEDIAERAEAPLDVLKTILDSDNKHSPFVMVDVEDAVAHTEEAIQKGRLGAVRCFTEADWGTTLPFYRPAGLRLDSCVEDLLTVLPKVAENREPEDFPIAGIVWPKSEHPDEIKWVCEILAGIEQKLGLKENQIRLEFLVESGYCLNQISQMAQACAHRLAGIIWGIADYSADTNLPRIQNDHAVSRWAIAEIVNLAGGLNVPAIDCMTLNYPTPVHRGPDLTDEQQADNKDKILGALKEVYDDARHGIELGLSGKWVGHPLQLLMVMTAYRGASSPAMIASDLKEIEAYSVSVEAGAGATMIGEGRAAYMADRATDRHLRARLRKATAQGNLPIAKAREIGVITEAEAKDLGGA